MLFKSNTRARSGLLIALFMYIFAGLLSAQQTICEKNSNFTPDIVIGANSGSLTKTSSLGITGWLNKKVLINGTLEVNSNFLISSCTVKMGDLGVIKVDNGFLLQSVYSNYFHCPTPTGNLWTGIQANGSLSFFFNQIEDASIALEIKAATASVVFVGNTVNRNNTGISAAGFAVNAIVAANTFDCTTPINGSTIALGTAGISLRFCPSAALGRTESVPAYRNIYRRQRCGISLVSSTATVGLSTFDSNTRGIYARSSFLTARGVDAGLTTDFTLNDEDVYTLATRMEIFHCNMDNCRKYNISSLSNNSLQRVDIHDNTIHVTADPSPTNEKMAISLDRTRLGSDGVFRNTIDKNHIIINNFGANYRRGMHIRGSLGIHDFLRVSDNVIDVGSGGSNDPVKQTKYIDVDISGADNFNITKNIINSTNTFNQGHNRWGIFTVNGALNPSKGNQMLENHITGFGPDDGCCAIHSEDGGPWRICSNTTDQTFRGFHFLGNCGESSFGANTMGNHNYDPQNTNIAGTGMLIQGHDADNAFIGDQVCQFNTWNVTDYSLPHAYTAIILGNGGNPPSSTTISNNEFKVANLSDATQAPIDRNPMTNWFKSASCLEPTGCVDVIVRWDDNDERIRNQYPTPQTTPGVEEWQSTRYVLSKLNQYPELVAGDPTGHIANFQSAYSQSSAAKFAKFDLAMSHVSDVAVNIQTPLQNLESAMQNKIAQINTLDAGINDYTNMASEVMINRALLLNDLANLTAQRNSLLDQIQGALQVKLDECEVANNSLPTNQIYEQNQKVINSIAIKRARGLELVQADIDALHSIAQQCSQMAGRTKSAAAAMLPTEEDIIYWREDPNLQDCAQRAGGRSNTVDTYDFQVSPNPASSLLHVEWQATATGQLLITDLSGRTLQSFEISEYGKSQDIPVQNFTNGMYLLSFKQASGAITVVSKFVVQH